MENIVEEAIKVASEFIKDIEDLSLDPYWDVNGWSIGYGHHFPPGSKKPARITKQQAEVYLHDDIQHVLDEINKDKLKLTVNQLASLLSLVYNIGTTAYSKSTIRKLLISHDIKNAAKEFDRWVKADGTVCKPLVHRRKLERQLFEKEDSNEKN